MRSSYLDSTSSLLINVILLQLTSATEKSIPIPVTFTAPGQYMFL